MPNDSSRASRSLAFGDSFTMTSRRMNPVTCA